jgi:hypothetical protein
LFSRAHDRSTNVLEKAERPPPLCDSHLRAFDAALNVDDLAKEVGRLAASHYLLVRRYAVPHKMVGTEAVDMQSLM